MPTSAAPSPNRRSGSGGRSWTGHALRVLRGRLEAPLERGDGGGLGAIARDAHLCCDAARRARRTSSTGAIGLCGSTA